MAKLTIVSMIGDKLELKIEENQRPSLFVGSLEVNKTHKPWHIQWQNLKITKFLEPLDKVKDKIVEFYELEKDRCCPKDKKCTIRKPGYATICSEKELWTIDSCKILNCKIEETEISLELVIDDVEYVSSFDRNITCD